MSPTSFRLILSRAHSTIVNSDKPVSCLIVLLQLFRDLRLFFGL